MTDTHRLIDALHGALTYPIADSAALDAAEALSMSGGETGDWSVRISGLPVADTLDRVERRGGGAGSACSITAPDGSRMSLRRSRRAEDYGAWYIRTWSADSRAVNTPCADAAEAAALFCERAHRWMSAEREAGQVVSVWCNNRTLKADVARAESIRRHGYDPAKRGQHAHISDFHQPVFTPKP